MTRPLIALVLFALLSYGAVELYPLLAGPSLTLSTPENGASYSGSVVKIEGRALRAAKLTVNGAPVFPDERGYFEAELAYPRGGSILTLTATDRFGRTRTRERTMYIP